MTRGLTAGTVLAGKYQIEAALGQGGMGAVYRATHLGTKRTVAVKVIHPQFSENLEFVERFRREAEAAGRLRHPNVVDVTDFGFAEIGAPGISSASSVTSSLEQVAYLVMEYLDGCSLAEILAEERLLPVDWVVDILEQACSAVEEAHQLGIIHRDLKPENIWMEPNRRGGYTVKVLDFGLVKLGAPAAGELGGPSNEGAIPPSSRLNRHSTALQRAVATGFGEEESATLIHDGAAEDAATRVQQDIPALGKPDLSQSPPTAGLRGPGSGGPDLSARLSLLQDASSQHALTRVGSIMGTPLYMAPEQFRGEPTNAQSDIYSLGVIAYRMLTGETPSGSSLEELARFHDSGDTPGSLREKNRKVSRRIARVVERALAPMPADRPRSAAAFASELRVAGEGSGRLLRQAVSLYSDRFPVFLKISLLAYAPLLLIVAVLFLSDVIDVLAEKAQQMMTVLAIILLPASLIASLFAFALVSALTVPVVVQTTIAPLRPVSVRAAVSAVRRRRGAFAIASVTALGIILVGTLLMVVPGMIAAVCFNLYAPVSIMENLRLGGTLKRAFGLMKRSWTTVVAITVLQFALPLAIWMLTAHPSLTLKFHEDLSPKEFSFGVNVSGKSSLFQLMNVVVTPLIAIISALLYLKTRRAGGESLKDAAEQFEALEVPRSRWQARMRSRGPSAASWHDGRKPGST